MPKTLSPAAIEAFRNRLCDVAEEKFAAHGPDGVTMRELAEALGVSSMTPYRYFEDKDAILAAVRTRAFNRFAEAMEAAYQRQQARAQARAQGGAGPEDEAGSGYLDFALANPAAYRLMFDVNQPTYEAYPDLVAAMDRARATMGKGLRELAAEGRLAGDVEVAAHALWAAVHGPVMLELAGALHPPVDARAIARPIIAGLIRELGLAPDQARKPRKK